MANENRRTRVAERVRVEVITLLARTVRDPGVNAITITRVSMTADLQIARIYYSVRDDENRREATLALRRARSYLRRKLGERLGLRLVPEIKFLYDDSLEQQQRLDSIFKEIELQRIKQTIMQTAEEDSDMSEEQYDS
jgi:ribosome-binding factor A